ncbi:hypothetical protein Tco_1251274, partial [Tanacetum coccineum]
HTRGALAAPLVPTLLDQLLRALTDFLEPFTLVVRLVLALGKMKPLGFLLGCVLLPLRSSFHRDQLFPYVEVDGFISDSQTQLALVNVNYDAGSAEERSSQND